MHNQCLNACEYVTQYKQGVWKIQLSSMRIKCTQVRIDFSWFMEWSGYAMNGICYGKGYKLVRVYDQELCRMVSTIMYSASIIDTLHYRILTFTFLR